MPPRPLRARELLAVGSSQRLRQHKHAHHEAYFAVLTPRRRESADASDVPRGQESYHRDNHPARAVRVEPGFGSLAIVTRSVSLESASVGVLYWAIGKQWAKSRVLWTIGKQCTCA